MCIRDRKKDFVSARHLDKKLYDVNEAPYRYEGRLDDVNDLSLIHI